MRRFNANQLHKSIVDDWVDWVHSATTSGVECWDNNTFLCKRECATCDFSSIWEKPTCLSNQHL